MIKQTAFAKTNEYPFLNWGASLVGNVKSCVQAVVLCATVFSNTMANDLSADDFPKMALIHPYNTADMATDEYVVMKANQSADSGTFQMTKMMRPMMFQT